MNTKLTVLAAVLLAGVSQAALAQEHDQDRWHDPGQSRPQVHAAPAPAPAPPPAPRAAPAPAPQAQPGGGDRHWGGGERNWNGGGDRARFQPQPQPGAPVAPPAAQPGPPQRDRSGHDARDGQHDWNRDRRDFAPGGTANGDHRWDRRDAPREVIPPPAQSGDRGWDRDRDGHGPAPGYADRQPRDGDRHWSGNDRRWDRDGHWDRDHRGPPANWRHWERGRLPPVYASSHRYRIGPYHTPYGWYVRSWSYGDFLPRGWFAPDYWVEDFWDYDLPYPPPGFHWVRVGDDALLVDDYSGRILQIVSDIFW